jgi:hypothetical protein
MVKKILQSENQPSARRGLSLRSVLLLVLLVGVGAGATAYALGTALAASAGSFTTPNRVQAQPVQQLVCIIAR